MKTVQRNRSRFGEVFVGSLVAPLLFCGFEISGQPLEETARSAAGARLVGFQPLSATSESSSALAASTAAADTRVVLKPLRVIQDSYSALSSVAVNVKTNEVVATDENHFQIMVYGRLDNTPARAAMTEPKRRIGGEKTEIEFQCGLYVDPVSGDIYAVNNDTKDKLVIFSQQAEGDVPPKRWLETPHGTFGIAVDEENQELFLTVQHDSAIVVYDKMASHEETPIRLLQGNRTRLADPHGIALDPVRGLLFVANYGSTHDVRAPEGEELIKDNWPLERDFAIRGSGKFYPPSINVYRRTAQGNTPPLRVIQGKKTQLNWPTGLAYHPERNEIYVTNDMTHSILIFDGDAAGNVAPKRILAGDKTSITNPTGIHIDFENQELWVANFGGHSLTVYDIDAGGNVAPKRMIRTAPADKPSLMIGNPGALAFDTKRGEILVPN